MALDVDFDFDDFDEDDDGRGGDNLAAPDNSKAEAMLSRIVSTEAVRSNV